MVPRQTEHASGIISFQHPKSAAIHADLEREKIHVMHHAGRLRVSIHGYNTAEDVERLVSVLAKSLT
ncbi:MAG: hypothetical protein HYY23_08320 [Verrucomicrobia bacterium]|nr:hypothetical protein [Verrucomicrobiota bacterium]